MRMATELRYGLNLSHAWPWLEPRQLLRFGGALSNFALATGTTSWYQLVLAGTSWYLLVPDMSGAPAKYEYAK